MFEPFYEVVDNVSAVIRDNEKKSNRPVIGVMPAYFPMELIHAVGGYPVQLWGNRLPLGKSDAYLQAYCCSVARAVLELELSGAADMVQAYAFTSLCDTLINLREIYRRICSKPTVELSIPITQTAEARRRYLESVIGDVLAGLQAVTGREATSDDLRASAALFATMRRLQRRFYEVRRRRPGIVNGRDFYTVIKAGFFLPVEDYIARLETLLEQVDSRPDPDRNRPKLLLSGMVFDPMEILDILDDLELDVVDDDFANGWRTVSKPGLQTGNLVEGVAAYLFDSAPCCCIYQPENDRHQYLLKKAKTSEADGILFWYVKFCEPDAFDRPQLAERMQREGIATATIDVELSMTQFDALKTRINAFGEMMEG